MEQFIGLDVSQRITHLCVIASDGKLVWQGQCPSTPEAFAATIKARAANVIRIGLESGPLSTGTGMHSTPWTCQWSASTPGMPRPPSACRSTRPTATTPTAWRKLSAWAGIARSALKALRGHTVRAMLGVRAQLIRIRTNTANQIRGILKTFGIVLGKGGGRVFEKQVQEIARRGGMLGDTLRALLAVRRNLGQQIVMLDQRANQFGKTSTPCRHLMTVPGVGIMTAIAFVTSVDDPAKFKWSRSVGAYLGLTPKRYQSGGRM